MKTHKERKQIERVKYWTRSSEILVAQSSGETRSFMIINTLHTHTQKEESEK